MLQGGGEWMIWAEGIRIGGYVHTVAPGRCGTDCGIKRKIGKRDIVILNKKADITCPKCRGAWDLKVKQIRDFMEV